jgi:hypothetical protein
MVRPIQTIIATVTAFAVVFIGVVAQAQSLTAPCKVGARAPAFGFWMWPINTRVKVYILAAYFKPEEIDYLLEPLRKWDAALEMSRSAIRLEYQGSTDQQQFCENCLTITRGPVFDKRGHVTESRAYSARSNQIITYASVVIDPVITNPVTLADVVAHELDHNFGLFDCYTCTKGSTVMNQLKRVNVPNVMSGPSACDVAQVRASYAQLKLRVLPFPKTAQLALADEGEEPVDDDTPEVIPPRLRT